MVMQHLPQVMGSGLNEATFDESLGILTRRLSGRMAAGLATERHYTKRR